MQRQPLFLPAVAICAGVLASRRVPLEPRELLWGIAALAGLACFALTKRERRAASCSCLAALALAGALSGAVHRRGPAPEVDAEPNEIVILGGCIVAPPAFSPDREQFVLELEPRARVRVSLYPREGERLPALSYGQRLEVDARVRRAHNFLNPGSFDYAGHLARQDIYWTASARPGAVRVIPGSCGSPLLNRVYRLRARILARLESFYPGDDYRTGMMQALLIGDSARLEKVWTEDFRRTGTYHALVISGLHVTVLAGLLLALLRICFVPEGWRLSLSATAAFLYAIVSGWTAPVTRAAAGFALFAAARYLHRRGLLLNVLAAVSIAFLVCDPEQMFESSFQLSFLAVASIAALAQPVVDRTAGPLAAGLSGLADPMRDLRLEPRAAHFRVELRLLAETVALWTGLRARICLYATGLLASALLWAVQLTLISALIQVGLLLPMAYYFHRVSLTGLTANLAIVPLTSWAIQAGFGSILTGWRLPAEAAAVLVNWAHHTASFHARWEPGWRIPGPPVWLALLFAAALAGIAVSWAVRKRLMSAPALASAAVAAASGALIVIHPFPPRIVPGSLEVSAIDVGQGDSLLIAFPDGKLALLDAGGLPAAGRKKPSQLDIGEDVVSPYLWSRSIRRIDVVIMSHAHEDHIGGLPAVIRNFRPREMWTSGLPPEAAAVAEEMRRYGTKLVVMRAGRTFHYGGVRVDALAPPPRADAAADNNSSLTLRLTHGSQSFLLMGDAEREVEAELLNPLLAPAQVLKVAHHGSGTSTGEDFVEAVRPALALVSAGFENQYRFPHARVVKRLESRGAAVLRTDRLGLISVRSDGRRLTVEAPCAP